jgi:SSS family solute:Na+ symporter
LYWKRTTSSAAFWGTILSVPVSIAIKYFFSAMPFLDQMLVSFFIISGIIILLSLLRKEDKNKGLDLPVGIFKTDRIFNVLSLIVILIFVSIYIVLW